MISISIYKLMHLAGLMCLFLGFGAVLFSFAAKAQLPVKTRALAFITHGLGLLFLIVGGFGMLARLGITDGIPAWAYAKLGIWILLGLLISPMKRKPQWTLRLIGLSVGLGVLAAAIAIYKPF